MINDTIAAISTPVGRGGIAVIRVSGNDALDICKKVFRPKNPNKTLTDYPSNTAVYGSIYNNERKIDTGLATSFISPNSFTGENTVEISCHGGILVTRRVLEAVLANGARMASAGEFTKRAFINGKLSLSEAEAVIGVINSENDAQLNLFSSHADGKLKDEVGKIKDELVHLLASIYAFIDFPDEDMTDVSVPDMVRKLEEIKDKLTSLKNSYKAGRAITEGIKTAIVGKPNVGKSSLLNLLLEKERAIVTEEAGTTRDTIEESLLFGDVTLRLCDTAGIRNTANKVEKIGVEISKEKISEAELIFAVFDGTKPLEEEDEETISLVEKNSCEKIAIINKSDKGTTADVGKIENCFTNIVYLSCKTGEGKEKLKDTVKSLYYDEKISSSSAMLSNLRQFNAVDLALSSVLDALSALGDSYTQDIAGMDIEKAVSSLALVDGKKVSEDIVNDIFSSFCVGK